MILPAEWVVLGRARIHQLILSRVYWHLRLLVLIALETTHLTGVDLVHVHICVHHQLILPDAGRGRGKEDKVKLEITRYSWKQHFTSLEREEQLRAGGTAAVRGGQSPWHSKEPAPIPTWTLLL